MSIRVHQSPVMSPTEWAHGATPPPVLTDELFHAIYNEFFGLVARGVSICPVWFPLAWDHKYQPIEDET